MVPRASYGTPARNFRTGYNAKMSHLRAYAGTRTKIFAQMIFVRYVSYQRGGVQQNRCAAYCVDKAVRPQRLREVFRAELQGTK